MRRALEADAGKALFISLRAQLQASDAERTVEGSGRWELIDTGDAKTIAAKGIPSPGRIPAASDALAIDGALKMLVGRLAHISCGNSEAKGSLCCARTELEDR